MLPAERAAAPAKARSRSTWTPPTWRYTAARSAGWPITTRGSGWLPDVASWAETEIVLAADLGDGPMTRARPRRGCCAAVVAAPRRAWASAGGAARTRAICRATGPGPPRRAHQLRDRRQADRAAVRPPADIADDAWHDAIDMDVVQVAVAEYCPDWWPASTRLLIRRVLLDPAQVSADPRSRRRRTLHPDQRALPIPELAGAGAIYAYSFILTNLDVTAPDKAVAAETGTGIAPASRTSSAKQARRRPPAPPLRIPPGEHGLDVGRAVPRAWPPGCTSSPPAPPARTSCTGMACAAARP